MIKVLFFAHLSEIAQTQSLEIPLPERVSVSNFIDHIKANTSAALIDALQNQSVRVSINQQFVGRESILNDGDELAFLPPVSGG